MSDARLEGRDVLVVDDELVAATVRAELARAGAREVVVAHSVRVAIARLKEKPADAIVLDYLLPDGDAGDVVQAVYAASRATGVVLVTRLAPELAHERAKQLRVDAVLRKPFDASVLIERVALAIAAADARANFAAELAAPPGNDGDAAYERVLCSLQASLTAVEFRTIKMLLDGWTVDGIAKEERITCGTVSRRVQRGLRRLDVDDPYALCRWVIDRLA
jgi:DNA-binding NarL/FixJ family response regulator